MSAENLISRYIDSTNKLYSIGMRNIMLSKKLLGTELLVNRPKAQSKYKQVFGGSYSSDDTLENDYTQFTVRLIINLNEMKDVWSRNTGAIEVFNDEDVLELGDEVQYTRDGLTYRFKVNAKYSYSENAVGVYQYSLVSMIETKED